MVSSPSDAPVRLPGTRTRSGNAMGRTRGAILAAAGECLERYGLRRTTMGDIASRGRLAKATLYNHFRTKSDVLDALLLAEIDRIAATARATAAGAGGLEAALCETAACLREHAALRRLATEEPALLAAIGTPGEGRLWDAARHGVAQALEAAGARADAAAVAVVLHWSAGQALAPGGEEEVALAAAILSAGLGPQP